MDGLFFISEVLVSTQALCKKFVIAWVLNGRESWIKQRS
jgi:hypothetical protein